MAIKIGSNVASIQAQRRLGEATSLLSKVYERLASGQRINSASDDAAGLAIADDLKAKTRVYTQAIRNGNDGLSVLAIGDSAIQTETDIVVKIRELAEQAANGSYTVKQRQALDNEAQALSKEFLRIGRTTTFNGINILDGSLGDGLRLQLGYEVEGSIKASVGGNLGTGTVSAATAYSTESNTSEGLTLGDLNGDGILDLVTTGYTDGGSSDGYTTVRIGNGSGSFGAATSYASENFVSSVVTLGDLNGDGILDLITAGLTDTPTPYDGVATVRIGVGDGTFGAATSYTTENRLSAAIALGDLNGDGLLDLVTAGQSDSGGGFATVRLGRGNGTFGSSTSFATETHDSRALGLGDLNGDGLLDLVTSGQSDSTAGFATVRLGNGSGSFGAATSYATEGVTSRGLALGDLNSDGILDLVTSGQSAGIQGYTTVFLGRGNGSFGAATSYATNSNQANAVKLGDLNGDGFLDMVAAGSSGSDGYATIFLGRGNGSFATPVSYTTDTAASNTLALEDLNGDGAVDLVTAGTNDSSDGSATVRLGNTRDGLAPLLTFTLKTQASSLQAMGMLDRALSNLAKQRGVIGSFQSRLGTAIESLASSRENYSSAEARIRDADIAEESSNLLRLQILQKSASAVLAQANQAPSLVITLLR